MAGKACPSLSVGGTTTDPRLIVRKMISYYDASDTTQSTLFFDQVRSLTQRIVQHGTNPNQLADVVRDDLTALLEPYMDSINLTATVVDLPNGRFNIDITGNYIYQKRRYDVAENVAIGAKNEPV